MHQTHALLNGDCNSCALARASVAETGSCMERSTASTWLPEQSASRAAKLSLTLRQMTRQAMREAYQHFSGDGNHLVAPIHTTRRKITE